MKLILAGLFSLLVALSLVSAFNSYGTGSNGDLTVTGSCFTPNTYDNLLQNTANGTTSFNVTGSGNLNLTSNGTDLMIVEMNNTDAGKYELLFQASQSGNNITLKTGQSLQNSYSGQAQVISIPNYGTVTVNAGASMCPLVITWTGGKPRGGILAVRAKNGITTVGTGVLNATAKGFQGGAHACPVNCGTSPVTEQGDSYNGTGVITDKNNGVAGSGIALICTSGTNNGAHGPGGAGQGGNGTAGIEEYDYFGPASFNTGAGGISIPQSNVASYMQIGGGGGGANAFSSNCLALDGKNGGGSILLWSRTITTLNVQTLGDTYYPLTSNDFGGPGGSGSLYIDALSLNISRIAAGQVHSAFYQSSAPFSNPIYGGPGIAGINANGITNGTMDVNYAWYGAWIQSYLSVPIYWQQNISNLTQSWNTSVFMWFNATNSTPSCTVQNFTTNTTAFPINLTTGVINTSANISKVGFYSMDLIANDNCSNSIDQFVSINVTYSPINITSIGITPSPTGTTNDLTCSVVINNTDNSVFSNYTKWYKNGTEQLALQNKSLVGKGNLTLADQWICSMSINDTRTTIPWTNSTTLTLGDLIPPIFNSFTQSNSAPVVSTGSDTFTVNTTDNQNIGTVKIQLSSNSFVPTNFTASYAGGNLYTYTFTPGLLETYTAIAYSIDGSNNVNMSTNLTFTPVVSSGGGGGGGGGGGSTTIIINNGGSNSTYALESSVIDKYLLVNDFSEKPMTFTITVGVNKNTISCAAQSPVTCTVINGGNNIQLTYVEPDKEFFSKTITTVVTATSSSGDLATLTGNLRLINLDYSVFGGGTTQIPDAVPYLLRVNNGVYDGIRLFPVALILLVIGAALVFL